jgi:hypothetical protein
VKILRALCIIPVEYSTQIGALDPKKVFSWELDKSETRVDMVADHMAKLAEKWKELTETGLQIEPQVCVSNVRVTRLQRRNRSLDITEPYPSQLVKDTRAWRRAHMRWLWVGLPSCVWQTLGKKLRAPHTNRHSNLIHILFNADEPISKCAAVNHEFKEWLVGWLKRDGVPDDELPNSDLDRKRFRSEYLAGKLLERIGGTG